jgi:transitional endoplasmic reticulum ATPase
MLQTIGLPKHFAVSEDDLALLPTQEKHLAELEYVSSASLMTFVAAERGIGTTRVLKAFAKKHNGLYVGDAEKLTILARGSNRYKDSGGVGYLLDLLEHTDLLVVDDLTRMGGELQQSSDHIQRVALVDRARSLGKRIVGSYVTNANYMSTLMLGNSRTRGNIARWIEFDMLRVEDLRVFLERRYGAESVADVDFDVLGRTMNVFSGYHLRRLAQILGDAPTLSTRSLVDQVQQARGGTNVRVEEVEALEFSSLPGTSHIASELETHVVLPLEHPELAKKLDIRAKRGVLLYGPPGSGKTSVGRALAHRMQGRFFLIDGSFPTEPPTLFFSMVRAVVEQAKRHAPSVIFIDDADVLFGIVHVTGLARYLLTLLDGMESETANKVCIMMTAMNVNKIPQPILRSGRVELWLSTRQPDVETRAAILQRWMGTEMVGHDKVDYLTIAERAEGCTQADLRRLIGDARTFYAADELAGRPTSTAEQYLRRALDELVETRERMAAHLKDDSLRVGAMREANVMAVSGA